MEEYHNFSEVDLEQISEWALEGFGDRYLQDALRIVNTGIVLPSDKEMMKLSVSIVIGLYFKSITEGINNGDKVIH